jgi:hypothetical protein
MAQQRELLASILGSFPVAELTTDEQKRVFESIRARLLQFEDVQEGLKTLYKVKGFADFAAGLLWVVDRSEKNPVSQGISMEDETLLLASFRKALGDQIAEPAAAVSEGVGGAEKDLAAALEKFTEAVQGGTPERETTLTDLAAICGGAELQGLGGEAAQFGSLLAECLKYISENQFYDDIRVINIFSNVSSSVSLWASNPPESRGNLLDEALGLVRDFKSQFE